MKEITATKDRVIQLGYEGEDMVTVLRFRYSADWLENGEGIFNIRVRRHGEQTAYNAVLVADDAENNCLLMTVTNTELSVKGAGEMQVVYSGADFVKKSPIYSYNVSRAVDEVTDPPAEDIYTQIIESLSDLQTDVSGITEDIEQIESSIGALSALTTAKIGDLTELTTMAKTDLVSAINEVNEHGGASVTVDNALSNVSENPVQNKVVTSAIQSKADIQTVSAISDAVNGLDGDIQSLQTGKADTSTVTALSGTVSGLQTAVQGKADAQTVTALSGTVTGLQTSKADKSYVDSELATKADAQTVTTLSGTVTGLQTSKADKSYVDAQLAGKAPAQTVSDLSDDVSDLQTGLAGKIEIPHTDEAKIAIQKMLGIYQAPWELIDERTFTNETEADYIITTDMYGAPFELTDIVLLFYLPKQNYAKKGSYGQVSYLYDNIPLITTEHGAWEQQATDLGRMLLSSVEYRNGMVFATQQVNNRPGYTASMTMRLSSTLFSQSSSIAFIPDFVVNAVNIKAVTGTGEYKLYGKRKWN